MAILYRWLALASVAALAKGDQVQQADLELPSTAAVHQQSVVDLFKASYAAYRQFAWPHDELRPDSKTYFDDGHSGGWGAIISDALDTLCLMKLDDWFAEAVNHVASVDFSVSQTNSSVFLYDATIIHVGGLLSAYELSGQRILVQKAEQLAQQLAYAFTGTPTPVPWNNVNFATQTGGQGTEGIGQVALTLEWNRLSSYTGNDTYRQLAEKAVQHIMQMPSKVLPGMPTIGIDPSTGNPSGDPYVTWADGSGSFYEYLIKYPRLTNTNDDSYTDAWLTAVDSSIRYLLKKSLVGDWTYLAEYDGSPVHRGWHSACFHGGNWILGGKLTNNDTIVDIGLRLTDACWNMYASTATGIGPDLFGFISSDGDYAAGIVPTAEQIKFSDKHGFYIIGPDYIMAPEVLESNFYAWRATGNHKYFDNAVRALKSFQRYLPATVGYGSIYDVNNRTSSKLDYTPSLWFAATLKYLYLTFDDPSRMSLDDYVFNTEGHPFKAPMAKDIYGSVV